MDSSFPYKYSLSAPSRNGDKTTVLFVDDDESILEGVRDLLTMNGYHVLTAENGRRALEIMISETPDLIVSDIKMPEMDGFEFYSAVRSNPTWNMIPFIFLTAFAQRSYQQRGQRLGVDAYLTKPFEADELLVAIEARLARVHDIQAASEATLEQLKQQLITIFSHELRTPLTYIYGYVHLLQDSYLDMERDAIGSMLKGIRSGADRLVRLVDDLMLLIRIDSGVIQVEVDQRQREIDLIDVLNQLNTRFEPVAAAAGLKLKVIIEQNPLTISGLEEHVVDMIARIIDNAIKFSPSSGSAVRVRAYRTDQDIFVEVKDEGVGIAASRLKGIFERFTQIDREQNEQQGLGMGLSIAGELAEAHGGSISVESQEGKGSIFTLKLPAR